MTQLSLIIVSGATVYIERLMWEDGEHDQHWESDVGRASGQSAMTQSASWLPPVLMHHWRAAGCAGCGARGHAAAGVHHSVCGAAQSGRRDHLSGQSGERSLEMLGSTFRLIRCTHNGFHQSCASVLLRGTQRQRCTKNSTSTSKSTWCQHLGRLVTGAHVQSCRATAASSWCGTGSSPSARRCCSTSSTARCSLVRCRSTPTHLIMLRTPTSLSWQSR